ncbi:GPCR kinase [Tanacetum coccineum]|uniref:GPCR kinase n=1 Tax=Tanacetum coccineum TaxID=301880 RepID=A0ABQ4X991_9ASTR
MACSVLHTSDEIKAMVEKQIEEDKARQLAIMNLAVEYGAAMILANVSVFIPKPSKNYLNITMINVVKVFHKDTVPKSGSGSDSG